MNSFAYHLRLRIARATLVLAIVAALLAWLLPFDMAAHGFRQGRYINGNQYARKTRILVLSTLLEILPDGYPRTTISMRLGFYSVEALLLLTLVLAPFCVSWLPRAKLIKWLWIIADLSLVLALIHGWRQIEFNFISGISHGFESTELHLHFLPGFYLACLAAFLHFTGLFLIPSARSLDHSTPFTSS